jgi:processive 1,2-diacylglycerol beta-glucosyltransferase
MSGEIKKIAVLSVSAGAGHVRAAEALRVTAAERFKDLELVHIDVMELVPKFFRKLYSESYVNIVNKHPALWGYLYNKSDRFESQDSQLKQLRLGIERLNTKKLKKTLQEVEPDAIICTHFLPAGLLDRMVRKGKTDIPCYVQVTDFDVHYLWIQSYLNGYFAASSEVAWRMVDRGVPEEKIQVTGIPIMPVFCQKYSRSECAAELGISPDKTTLLMMSGGLGIGGIDSQAERLLKIDKDFQIIALAGKNQKLLEKLEDLEKKWPGKFKAMGFTDKVERLMAVSDLVISKPGGLTTSECLAMGLPMIAVSPIPGQEERNADYLLENGAALKAYDVAGLEFRVMELLNNPERLDKMRANAIAISTPDAAFEVLKTVTGRSS